MWRKAEFSAAPTSFFSDPYEIILICWWFSAKETLCIIINVKNSWAA